MKRTSIQLLLLPLISLLSVSCDSAGITSPDPAVPSEFAGTYELVSIDGSNVPAVVDSFVDGGKQVEIRVIEGGVVLKLDGTLRDTRLEEHYVDGALVFSKRITRDGTWVTDDEQIDVTWEGEANDYTTFLYDEDSGTLELEANPPAGLLGHVYQKAETIRMPDPADPSEFGGSYELVSFGGESLPVVVDSFVDDGAQVEVRLIEASLVLDQDGAASETRLHRHYRDGVQGFSDTRTLTGTWTTDQEEIRVTWAGGASANSVFLYFGDSEELELEPNPAAGRPVQIFQKVD